MKKDYMTRKQPFFSFIMVKKGRGSLVSESIDSLRKQSFDSWELIIKDCGPKDDTSAMVKQLSDNRITFIEKKDSGIYDAINQALAYTNGEVVGFLHVNDFLEQNALSSLYSVFQNDANLSGVYCGVKFVSANGTITREWMPTVYKKCSTFFGWMPPHTGLFVRKPFYDLIPFDVEYKISGDYNWILDFLKLDPNLIRVNKFIMRMSDDGVSSVSFKGQLAKLREDRRVLIRNFGFFYFIPLFLKPLQKIGQFKFRIK